MENWQIAMINETRRRQAQISEAQMYRLAKQVPAPTPGWKRTYQNVLLQLAELLIELGTRLQCRYAELAAPPNAEPEPSPCT